MLFRFVNSEDLALWSTFSDAEVGGKSTAALQPAEEPKVGAMGLPHMRGIGLTLCRALAKVFERVELLVTRVFSCSARPAAGTHTASLLAHLPITRWPPIPCIGSAPPSTSLLCFSVTPQGTALFTGSYSTEVGWFLLYPCEPQRHAARAECTWRCRWSRPPTNVPLGVPPHPATACMLPAVSLVARWGRGRTRACGAAATQASAARPRMRPWIWKTLMRWFSGGLLVACACADVGCTARLS